MIIQKTEHNVTASGFSGKSDFSIKASAKAFRILSDKLYQRKIHAIIRELSTNAVDAHFDVSQTKPFEITLPDIFEPTFKIRDFGPGLSNKSIETVYTTYFESTKEESNDYNGALGLGSKSPFSYTNSFTVTSYQDNKKNIYTAFISDAETPAILHAGTYDTQEENGLEISFPVNKSDISEFKTAANDILQWFTIPPKVQGSNIVQSYTRQYSFEDFFLYTTHSYDTGPKIVMANVCYPIRPHAFTKCSQKTQEILKKNIIFNVPTGSVNFAPSREELNYDPITIEYINKIAENAFDTILDYVYKQVASIKNKWDRTCKFIELSAGSLQLSLISNKNLGLIDGIVKHPADVKSYYYIPGAKNPYMINYLVEDNESKRFTVKKESTFFVCYSKTASGITNFSLYRADNPAAINAYFITGPKENVDSIIEQLGNPPITDVTNAVINGKKIQIASAYSVSGKYNGTFEIARKTVNRIYTPIEDLSGYYIVVENFSSLEVHNNDNEKLDQYSITLLYRSFTSLGQKMPDSIYLFRRSDMEAIKENKNLSPIRHFFADAYEKLSFNIDQRVYDVLSYDRRNYVQIFKKMPELARIDPLFHPLININLKNSVGAAKEYNTIVQYAEKLGKDATHGEADFKTRLEVVNSALVGIIKKYPLITRLSSHSIAMTEIKDYITAMSFYITHHDK